MFNFCLNERALFEELAQLCSRVIFKNRPHYYNPWALFFSIKNGETKVGKATKQEKENLKVNQRPSDYGFLQDNCMGVHEEIV